MKTVSEMVSEPACSASLHGLDVVSGALLSTVHTRARTASLSKPSSRGQIVAGASRAFESG